jgi:uncharacterized protein YqeY
VTSDPTAAADGVRAQLQQQLRIAMKARDTTATKALRATLGAIGNAEAVAAPATRDGATSTVGSGPIAGAVDGLGATEVARRDLSEADVEALVRREIDDRVAAARDYERLGRADEATELLAQCDALRDALSNARR